MLCRTREAVVKKKPFKPSKKYRQDLHIKPSNKYRQDLYNKEDKLLHAKHLF